MPSGKTHAIATTLAAGSLGPLLVLVGQQPVANAAAFSAGCMLGLVINPDLDVDHWTRSHSLVRRSTGCLGGGLWFLFWWPYARLIPHRSPLSHMPVFGTLLRLGYLLAIPALILWSISAYTGQPLPWSFSRPDPLWYWVTAGLIIADSLHALMDYAA